MAKIAINIESGGLGRQSANTDTWGGLFVEVDAMPTEGGGWTENEVKQIAKVEDLAAYGITEEATNNYFKLVYWHVSELFRLAPNATLYLQLASVDVSAATVLTAFKNAQNKLRLFAAVLPGTEIGSTAAEAWQTALDNLFSTAVQPAGIVLSFDKETASGALPDFSAGTTNTRVMVEIANDLTAGGLAKTILDSAVGMCGAAGTFLGQLLRLSVHQKPSWRSFPVNGGGRWATLGDINGDSVEDLTQAEIDGYDTNGLSLITRTLRLTDAFIANSRMAIKTSDDYAIMTHRRVIDKAAVLAYDGLVLSLDSPVYVDPETGYLTPESISKLQRAAYDSINTNMVRGRTGDDVEVSVDLATGSLPLDSVYIDPSQDLLSTENINVEVRIVPVGSAKTITINIGLTASL